MIELIWNVGQAADIRDIESLDDARQRLNKNPHLFDSSINKYTYYFAYIEKYGYSLKSIHADVPKKIKIYKIKCKYLIVAEYKNNKLLLSGAVRSLDTAKRVVSNILYFMDAHYLEIRDIKRMERKNYA